MSKYFSKLLDVWVVLAATVISLQAHAEQVGDWHISTRVDNGKKMILSTPVSDHDGALLFASKGDVFFSWNSDYCNSPQEMRNFSLAVNGVKLPSQIFCADDKSYFGANTVAVLPKSDTASISYLAETLKKAKYVTIHGATYSAQGFTKAYEVYTK